MPKKYATKSESQQPGPFLRSMYYPGSLANRNINVTQKDWGQRMLKGPSGINNPENNIYVMN
jgi:hypothetical protein